MAAATTIAMGVTAAAGIGKTISGAVRANKAKRDLKNFKRQELTNIAEGLSVSTLGAELQQREASRRFATSVDALQAGGVRGVVGGLARQEAQQQRVTQQIAANLDQQQKQIDMMRAQDEARIRGMQETREEDAMSVMRAERASARQTMMSGLSDVAGAAMQFGMQGMEAGEGRAKDLTSLPGAESLIAQSHKMIGSSRMFDEQYFKTIGSTQSQLDQLSGLRSVAARQGIKTTP